MPSLYSTDYLTGVVRSLRVPPSFLLDSFFGSMQTEESEEIHFDTESDVMKLAPLVSPIVEGEIVTEKGFTTTTYKPAYIKPKTPLDQSRPFRRSMGEQIGGNLSPQQRRQAIIAEVLRDHRTMFDRRMEWMAANVLANGSLTLVGKKYPQEVVDFNRDASLTVTLTTPNLWGEADVNPLDDLQDWTTLIQDASGATAATVVMTTDVWKVFRASADVTGRLNLQRVYQNFPTMAQAADFGEGGSYKGNIDGFDIWTYAGTYHDDAGDKQNMLPAGTVLLVGDIMGTRAFGAIKDEEQGLSAVEYFSKSWVENDPSQRFIMTQSAPLTVPYRINASLKAKVLA